MKPMCCKCKRFYRPDKNGVYVLEQSPIGEGVEPGTEMEESWRPYKVWSADRWKCHGCGHVLVSGWGAEPVARNYEHDKMEHYLQSVTEVVNDC